VETAVLAKGVGRGRGDRGCVVPAVLEGTGGAGAGRAGCLAALGSATLLALEALEISESLASGCSDLSTGALPVSVCDQYALEQRAISLPFCLGFSGMTGSSSSMLKFSMCLVRYLSSKM
jgi:hypothetical protein